MRKQLLQGLATFVVLLTLTVASAHAQTGSEIAANIPFDFTAGKTSLRAGIYKVRLISENALLVRSSDGKKGVLLIARQTEQRGTEKPARLVFNRYGDRYFLSQTFLSDANLGCEVSPSGEERDLATEYRLAKGDRKSQRVEVAVR